MLQPTSTEDAAHGNQLTADAQTVSRHVTACPKCGDDVVDGQGVLDCTDCDWLALVT